MIGRAARTSRRRIREAGLRESGEAAAACQADIAVRAEGIGITRKDDLVHRIAGLILSDSRIAPHRWGAVAVVQTLTDGSSGLNRCRSLVTDSEPDTPPKQCRQHP
ncbi:MAG: hypothetical protein MUE98_05555 [Rhodobacteraceae bacterium]|jgi:hypothetical protein|nr:hypothetical protein [Paracoccaceae bacterium]